MLGARADEADARGRRLELLANLRAPGPFERGAAGAGRCLECPKSDPARSSARSRRRERVVRRVRRPRRSGVLRASERCGACDDIGQRERDREFRSAPSARTAPITSQPRAGKAFYRDRKDRTYLCFDPLPLETRAVLFLMR